MTIQVYLERGTKKVFACAYDWPGWCRSGKTEELAIEALGDYRARYAPVVEEAGLRMPRGDFEVVERIPGDGTTDFGAPGAVPALDKEPLTRKRAERLATLVAASWTVFDRVVAAAPATLRKGPRGGGRDRDPMVEHVLDAEQSYARTLGVPAPRTREAILAAIRAAAPDTRWPARYAARRIAWHVLDHAWEIEDKSE